MARIKGPRKVHRYSAEFKLKAVKLSQIEGVQVQNVADALDIHPFMLSRWLSSRPRRKTSRRATASARPRATSDASGSTPASSSPPTATSSSTSTASRA